MTAPKEKLKELRQRRDQEPSLAERAASKYRDDIVEAVLLCDFSRILADKFVVGDSSLGLSNIIQAKQKLLNVVPDDDRFRRRAIEQLTVCDLEGARQTLEVLYDK